MSLDSTQLEASLRRTGEILASQEVPAPIRLLVAGGAAGLLGGLLKGSRTTGDCDVMALQPEESWDRIQSAAKAVAKELGLPESWLNWECRTFAWCMPLGWEDRCKDAGTFGPLEVWRVSRVDLIAAKIISAPKRPQDLEDIRQMRPTTDDLAFAEAHLDRMDNESLDSGTSMSAQRAILDALRGEL